LGGEAWNILGREDLRVLDAIARVAKRFGIIRKSVAIGV
jgi:hypothetical protein